MPNHRQPNLQSLYKDSKEETFHIKTARTYFCMQNMVSINLLLISTAANAQCLDFNVRPDHLYVCL